MIYAFLHLLSFNITDIISRKQNHIINSTTKASHRSHIISDSSLHFALKWLPYESFEVTEW